MPKQTPKLTPKQERFVEIYVATGNGSEAARQAGYSGTDQTLHSVAYENLAKPHIAERIRERRDQLLGEVHTSQRQVFGALSSQMHADVSRFFDDDDRFIGMARVRELGIGSLIKSIHLKSYYRRDETRVPLRIEVVRLELHSAQTAADKLAALLDMKRPAPVDAQLAELISSVKKDYLFYSRLSSHIKANTGHGLTREQIIDSIAGGFPDNLRDIVIRECVTFADQMTPTQSTPNSEVF